MSGVVDDVVGAFRAGGRLLYVGAGTSGRLGVLDAAECPPTFGVSRELVTGILAGGDAALKQAVEGAEDAEPEGALAIRRSSVRAQDVVCGIAASGFTPFVWGALEEAALRDATIVLVTSNPEWSTHPRAKLVDHAIVIPVGPEIIAGSTRMKAGTATKLVLNTLSTAAMVRWGKVHDNLMVDVVPTNRKLRLRAARLVEQLGQVPTPQAVALLEAADWNVKAAVLTAQKGVAPAEAKILLERHGGILRKALEGEANPPGASA
jgi:N-acetylmuramic acid 6-phosphate etherase